MVDTLAAGEIELVGRLRDASNAAYLVAVGAGRLLAIYKPVTGERPLWDFPDGTLAARERAAFLVSEAGRWGIVPETVLRPGPHGPGSVQRWVGHPETAPEHVVDVVAPTAVPDGWLPVLEGQDQRGETVLVVHEDSEPVASVAAFDAVVNNSDRKGSHIVREDGGVRGFDHGVCFHADDKLRTVLWGFAGRPLPGAELDRLRALRAQLEDSESALRRELAGLLTASEVAALAARTARLLADAAYPLPGQGWPAIPWPPI